MFRDIPMPLKCLALDQHTMMHQLTCQALNELFASHQLPEIARKHQPHALQSAWTADSAGLYHDP